MADNSNKMLDELSRLLGVSPSELKNSVKNGNTQDIINKTDSKTAEKINEILSNPEKTKQFLSSPQAQALMKLLNGE
jgi:hypothetical protein